MSETNDVVHDTLTKSQKVKINLITRFVSRTGKNTRQAIPVLTSAGYVYFPSELTPDLLAERNDEPAEGKTKPPFVGVDKDHPYGIVMWDMVFSPSADLKSKKFYIKLIRECEPGIYGIAQSIYGLGQRTDIELVQDEEGFKLVDGFIRLVCCTIRDLLAEIAQNKPWGTIKAKVVDETSQDRLEDISYHLNSMRREVTKSDLARRMYEMSLLGREDEAGEDAPQEDGKKRRVKKALSDTEIATRCGLPKDGGRQRVYQFRTVYEWCVKQGAKGQGYLDRWDAGKVTLDELLKKANAKPGTGGEPKDKKETRPRCLSYPAAYKIYANDALLTSAVEKMAPEVPLPVRLALVREGMKIAMQQQGKPTVEVPMTGQQETPPATPQETPAVQENSPAAPTDAA